jgi:hypothetical protein
LNAKFTTNSLNQELSSLMNLSNWSTDAESYEGFANAVASKYTKDELTFLISFLVTALSLKLKGDSQVQTDPSS